MRFIGDERKMLGERTMKTFLIVLGKIMLFLLKAIGFVCLSALRLMVFLAKVLFVFVFSAAGVHLSPRSY